jgi:hypothetical protein
MSTMQSKIEMGDTYRDRCTGFTGVATTLKFFIGDAETYVLLERLGDDRERIIELWFDESRLTLVDEITPGGYV